MSWMIDPQHDDDDDDHEHDHEEEGAITI